MQMLKAKLYLLKQQENAEKAAGIRGEVTEIGWGNQIRSYVMQPYTMVKDHRTGVETGNVDSVLDGKLDIFMNGYLKWLSSAARRDLEETMSSDVIRTLKWVFGKGGLIEEYKRQEQMLEETPKSVASMTRIFAPQISRDFPGMNLEQFEALAQQQLVAALQAEVGGESGKRRARFR